MFGDGEVQVYETFVNPLMLRDGFARDVTNYNIEVVLDIRHNMDLDSEDSVSKNTVYRVSVSRSHTIQRIRIRYWIR